MLNHKITESDTREKRKRLLPVLVILPFIFASCSEIHDLDGELRAILKSPGGDLAFEDEKFRNKPLLVYLNGSATGPYYYNEIERFKRSLDEITKN